MNERDRLKLNHMHIACKELLAFTKDVKQEDFINNRVLVLACIKEIEIIGEAASKISPETKQKINDIPWQDIINTRHRLIHGYFNINLATVWKTITDDIPSLADSIQNVMVKT